MDGPRLARVFCDEQWSLAVMCPAFRYGLIRPLALMDSADRGLISWSGLEPIEAVRFLSICRMTDRTITYIYSRKLAARSGLAGYAASAACR